MVKVPNIQIRLEELNHSEVVALANWCGLNATRAIPRHLIVEALKTFTPFREPNPVDPSRSKLSKWLEQHWSRIKMQAQKKVCPRCDQCRDTQVLECFTTNRKYIER